MGQAVASSGIRIIKPLSPPILLLKPG